jgi:hypothetical protein
VQARSRRDRLLQVWVHFKYCEIDGESPQPYVCRFAQPGQMLNRDRGPAILATACQTDAATGLAGGRESQRHWFLPLA